MSNSRGFFRRKSLSNFLVTALFALCVMMLANSQAQVSQSFNYQAVMSDSTGTLIANQAVALQATLWQDSIGGTLLYRETHLPTSNQFGLVSLRIGAGTVALGNFSAIDWATANPVLQMEIDPAGGTNFSPLGTSNCQSVP